MLRSRDHVFQIVPIFDKDRMNMSFRGKQIEEIVAILLLKSPIGILNGTLLNIFENFEYDH